ncbi:MAG: hypothetical protein ACFFDN_37090 [Candidatus Hodarchaeota archaeon]
MGKDMIAGGAIAGALIILILDIIIGVSAGLQYWGSPVERRAIAFAIGIAYYQHLPANVYISVIICIIGGLFAGLIAKGPLYGLIAGAGAYIGSLLGILIISGFASLIFAPTIPAEVIFRMDDLGAVITGSMIWGIWLVIGLAFVGGMLNKEGEWRG